VCDLEAGKPQWPSNLGDFQNFLVIMGRIAPKVWGKRLNALLASLRPSPTASKPSRSHLARSITQIYPWTNSDIASYLRETGCDVTANFSLGRAKRRAAADQ
jgi:hypothetical protein